MTISEHAARILREGTANSLHTASAFVRSARESLKVGDIHDALVYGQAAEAHVVLALSLADERDGFDEERAEQYRASADEIRARAAAVVAEVWEKSEYRRTPGPHLTAAPEPAEPAYDGTTGKFRVGGLSGLNSRALREVGADRLGFVKLGSTFVVFTGTPDSVAVELQTVMDEIRAKRGGQDSTYRSLIAVRNKVLAGYGSKHVKVEP